MDENGTPISAMVDDFKNNYLAGTIAERYYVSFKPKNDDYHGYIPPIDEIAIYTGHWCTNREGVENTEPEGNPVTGDHSKPQYFALWLTLEAGPVFCIDNTVPVYES